MNQCAIIFDLDGTLTRPYLDFDAIRAEIGVEGTILEAIAKLDPESRRRAEAVLLRYEREAADNATPQRGAAEVVETLRANGHPVAILTRNARSTTAVVLEKLGIVVDAVRTREDGAIKPSAEPLLSLCDQLHAAPSRSWIIGDHEMDILSGRAAGTRTVLLICDGPRPDYADLADHVIRTLTELPALIDGG